MGLTFPKSHDTVLLQLLELPSIALAFIQLPVIYNPFGTIAGPPQNQPLEAETF